ncbi:hypothetical protein KNP414_06583 [Paenibacillus mucilaginosus KNP414]|uniref:Uncharacterized protein n=1 Tax=Paenibacillus mucilaginosus (strain KNP414) TaxID=1036673 RepID=F8F779_PAEMK|nr:hypothetical protein KNP414_06583 [Paenibacillus mucilaginosus KNP414]
MEGLRLPLHFHNPLCKTKLDHERSARLPKSMICVKSVRFCKKTAGGVGW